MSGLGCKGFRVGAFRMSRCWGVRVLQFTA